MNISHHHKRVKLISFLGSTVAPENTRSYENYWRLIGQTGFVHNTPVPNDMRNHPRGERVLVVFDCDLNDFGLASHNDIDRSLWIFTSDLGLLSLSE
jgi:hypothetical protein